ncbi:MAG: hypothetical protein ABSB81_01175 [Halobacteriota archaeon]|jgi:hypothetical protein
MNFDYFFDSNILIGSRLSWDAQYEVACDCVDKQQIKKRTSDNVYWESSFKLEKVRQVIWTFLKEILNNSFKFNPWNFDSKIHSRKLSFLKRQYPTKEIREDAEDILNPFLDKYGHNMRDSILNNDEIKCCKMAEDSVNNAISSLDVDCFAHPSAKIEMHVVTPQDIKHYASKERALQKKISDNSDILILLDSYHIKQTVTGNNSICFVTTDKEHISDNSGDIEKILVGVRIRNPNEKPL